jgi:hypothetical protein
MELDDTLRDAIMTYHAVMAAVPVDTEKYAKQRADSWKKYLDSLDLKKMMKAKKDRMNPIKQLTGLIPINLKK